MRNVWTIQDADFKPINLRGQWSVAHFVVNISILKDATMISDVRIKVWVEFCD